MKPITLTLVAFLCVSSFAIAQSGLEGTWKGTMTVGGLESKKTVPFELFLQQKGAKIEGRSYIYLEDKTVIEMEVKGSLFGDLSIYLKETDYIEDPTSDYQPEFNRKYQLLYKPSIWNTKMEGYWQELTDHHFSEKRRLGMVRLKKMKDKKRA